MLLYGIVWVSLILSYITEVRRTGVGSDDAVGRPTGAAGASTTGPRSRAMEQQ